jgi:hypothetical protein
MLTTNEVASELGIAPRTLRQFLRSPASTFAAVGSGSRYEFKESDLPTIRKRFAEWSGNGRAKHDLRPDRAPRVRSRRVEITQDMRDRAVWAEEEAEHGPVVLPDIRDPRVRKRVLDASRAAEDRLMMRLMAVGLHVTQLGDRS